MHSLNLLLKKLKLLGLGLNGTPHKDTMPSRDTLGEIYQLISDVML